MGGWRGMGGGGKGEGDVGMGEGRGDRKGMGIVWEYGALINVPTTLSFGST